LRFCRILDEAASIAEPLQRRAKLDEALTLWRGGPFEDLHSPWLEQVEHPRLLERYLTAVEQRIDLDLDLGLVHATRLVAELNALTGQHPLRESLWARLLIALSRCGRDAEALARYGHIRARLADELGTEPGPHLQRVYARLLAGTPQRTLTHSNERDGIDRGAALPRRTPRELPASPAGFTGRGAEIDSLNRLHEPSEVVLTAICGMAGVGKTALAIHAAHRLADHYPDGQIFVDLHGYSAGVAPVHPSESLERMLRSLGVADERIPSGVEERAALYRSCVAGRRLLILLDNAGSEDQVVPLVPGTPGCHVVVTSRRRLTALDATRTVLLDVLPLGDSLALFKRIVGEQRLRDVPTEQLVRVVSLCGRLPLAVRIAGARLRSHPMWAVSDLIERLRAEHDRLSELYAGSRTVTAALDLSYHQLGPQAQHAYRMLGLYPSAEFTVSAAAALGATTVDEAGHQIEQLLEAHLLNEVTAGRYAFHDLVRIHAYATAIRQDTDVARADAIDRLLDHYAHLASVAMASAYPYEPERRPAMPSASATAVDLGSSTEALAWLDAELVNVLATVAVAQNHNRPAYLSHMSATLHRHLRTRGRYADARRLHLPALKAARARDDRHSELRALLAIGDTERFSGSYVTAARHFQRALHVARAIGDAVGEADALIYLDHTGSSGNGLDQSAGYLDRALHLARSVHHRSGEAEALLRLGTHYSRSRCDDRALEYFGQALAVARKIEHLPAQLHALVCSARIELSHGQHPSAEAKLKLAVRMARRVDDRNWQFEALNGLAELNYATGDYARACSHNHEALSHAIHLGQQADQARAHNGLAMAYFSLHRLQPARRHWRAAVAILDRLGPAAIDDGSVNADKIRARLAELPE
jgi:tetratricopeptide (TPR) repeat protein